MVGITRVGESSGKKFPVSGVRDCWGVDPYWEWRGSSIDWVHYLHSQFQIPIAEQTLALIPEQDLRGDRRVNSRREDSKKENEMQMVGFYRFVGESVKLSHENNFALVPWPDKLMEESSLLTVSNWVLNAKEQVSGVLGLSFEGLEHMAWELFAELEKRAPSNQGQGMDRGNERKTKISRELKNLSWGLSYGKEGILGREKLMKGHQEGCVRVSDEVQCVIVECEGLR